MPCAGASSSCFVGPYSAGVLNAPGWEVPETVLPGVPDVIDDEVVGINARRAMRRQNAAMMTPAARSVQVALQHDQLLDNYLALNNFRPLQLVPGAYEMSPALSSAGYHSVLHPGRNYMRRW